MKNLKIGGKIIVAFALVIVLLVTISVSVLSTNTTSANALDDVMAFSDFQDLTYAVRGTFYEARIYANILVYHDSDQAYNDFISHADATDVAITNVMDFANKHPEQVSEYKEALETIKQVIGQWRATFEEFHAVQLNQRELKATAVEASNFMANTLASAIQQRAQTGYDAQSVASFADQVVAIKDIQTAAMHLMETNDTEAFHEMEDSISSINAALTFMRDSATEANKQTYQKFIDTWTVFTDALAEYDADIDKNVQTNLDARALGTQAITIVASGVETVAKKLLAMLVGVEKSQNTSLIVVISISVVSILFAIFMAIFISKLIVTPLDRVRTALVQVGRTGNLHFDKDFEDKIKDDAIGKDETSQCASALVDLIGRLNTVNDYLTKISDGDLTMDIALASNDDSMGQALQKMVDSLGHTFNEITNTSVEVAVSAKGIAESSITLAQGATEQTAAVDALCKSITNVSYKTKESADLAVSAAKLGDTIKQNAEIGSQQMEQMMQAVKEINDASTSINKVIKVIDDIAFQTNILALNAAVEAARAGQHGKGFAVVAEEVRSLAAKSANAAKETGDLIANSIEKAELGARIANSTSASLSEIVSGINESSKIVNIIAHSSEAQTSAIQEINKGVNQVGEVVALISKGAEVSSSASYSMQHQSDALHQFVSEYSVKSSGSNSGLKRLSSSSSNRPQIEMRPQEDEDDGFGKY